MESDEMAARLNLKDLGQLGLTGWRRRVVDRIADPVAERAPFSGDDLKAVIGLAFFALSAYYLVSTIAKASKQVRAVRRGVAPAPQLVPA